MNKRILFITSFMLLLFIHTSAWGADWYIDNLASGANNGNSWSNAWQSFSSINWGAINPGDTIYISGGNSSKTYNELLRIDKSGSEGLPITITVGANSPDPVGHSGDVWIDRNYGLEWPNSVGIYFSNRSYIKITGKIGADTECHFHVTRTSSDNISISGKSHNIEIAYLDLSYADYSGSAHSTNLYFDGSDNENMGEIHHCIFKHSGCFGIWIAGTGSNHEAYGSLKIHNNKIYNFHGDGAHIDGWSVDFYDNEIYNALSPIGGEHPDGIQSASNYIRIFNNKFYNFVQEDGTADWNAYIRYNPNHTGIRGYARIYNNLFYETRTPVSGTVGRGIEISPNAWPGGSTGVREIYFLNNTVAAGPFFGLYFGLRSDMNTGTVDDLVIVNNIFMDIAYTGSAGGGANAIAIETGDGSITTGTFGSGADFIIDRNLIYASSSNFKTSVSYGPYNNTMSYSYANFKSQSNSQQTDFGSPINPSLNKRFFPDDLNDPGVLNGVNFSHLFSFDLTGRDRSTSGQWTIGAYNKIHTAPVLRKVE
jgi:hypothetical protein